MKKAFRLACCLSATCVMFAFSACAKLSKSFVASDSSEKSYAEDEWNPSEDAMVGNSSVITDGTENETDSEDISVFEPTLPDDEKEILRMETGDIGHKIVYYTDGTCEDLGRITPIDFKPISPAEKEGYQYFSTLEKAEGLCAFYQEIFTVACNFHASEKNVTFT
ncbi:MAG: hypothetical protein IJ373_07605 [Clostridia bacterium]|nr:hypothetical protein [Clostridia bacterium]